MIAFAQPLLNHCTGFILGTGIHYHNLISKITDIFQPAHYILRLIPGNQAGRNSQLCRLPGHIGKKSPTGTYLPDSFLRQQARFQTIISIIKAQCLPQLLRCFLIAVKLCQALTILCMKIRHFWKVLYGQRG